MSARDELRAVLSWLDAHPEVEPVWMSLRGAPPGPIVQVERDDFERHAEGIQRQSVVPYAVHLRSQLEGFELLCIECPESRSVPITLPPEAP